MATPRHVFYAEQRIWGENCASVPSPSTELALLEFTVIDASRKMRSQNSQTPAAIVEMGKLSTKKTGYPQICHFDGVGYLKMDGSYRKTKKSVDQRGFQRMS